MGNAGIYTEPDGITQSRKTSRIIETLRRMKNDYRFAVIEGNIEAQVDTDQLAAEGVTAIQLRAVNAQGSGVFKNIIS